MKIQVNKYFKLTVNILEQNCLVEDENEIYQSCDLPYFEKMTFSGRMVKPMEDLWSLILDETAIISSNPSVQTKDLRFEELCEENSISSKDYICCWAQFCIDGSLSGETFFIKVQIFVHSIEEIEMP
jgi:hypothetical protein